MLIGVEEKFGAVGGGGAIEIVLWRGGSWLTLEFLSDFLIDAVNKNGFPWWRLLFLLRLRCPYK